MAIKIFIKEVIRSLSYIEVSYEFTLEVPANQVGKPDPSLTKTIEGKASYLIGVSANYIKTNLINRYNTEQTALNNDTSKMFYGLTWDGSVWV